MRACGTIPIAGVLGVLVLTGVAGAQTSGGEPTVAVLDFIVDRNGGLALPRAFGASAADLLVNQLVESGRYRVLDRLWLHGRTMPASDRDPALDSLRAAALAENVDYLVIGSISRYSNEDRSRTYGGGVFRVPLIGGLRRNRMESVIALAVRVVDVRTGEIVATAAPEAAASRKKFSLGVLGLFGAGGAAHAPAAPPRRATCS